MEHILLTQLATIVGTDYIISEPAYKVKYTTDWRHRYFGLALAIVKPQSVTQIVELVKFCQVHNLSIIPQGGNTSLCGGSVPLNVSTKPQLVINLSHLNKILAVDTQNNSICVEAGCTLQQIVDQAQLGGQYFPLNIASAGSCQIGGNIATNAGGIHVVKYGMMRDMVLGLEVVLPDGRIINQLNSLRKNNTYLDLKQLFIGSEGTLGIITKAVLKLFPEPTNYITGLLALSDIPQAIAIFNQLNQDFKVCAFEIIGITAQNIYNSHFSSTKLPLNNNWLVLFELENENFDNVLENINNYKINQQELIITDCLSRRKLLWQMRENIPLAEKMYGLAIKHDISLPISNIEKFIANNKQNISTHYPKAQIIVFGHLGDGNLHYNVQLNSQQETLANEQKINQIVYSDVIELGGSISAEHGIGQLKADRYKQTADPSSYDLLHQIKNLVDPNNLFNPGKIFSK